MKLRPHPKYDVFVAWFAKRRAHTLPLDDVFYRTAGPKHTTAKEIVSGIGARNTGGRWNPPGAMNVLYVSQSATTAMIESVASLRYYGIPEWKGMPKVTIAVRVAANAVLDLTDSAVNAEMPEVMAALMAQDWRKLMDRGEEPTTQAMGRAAYENGIQGLTVPSQPDFKGINLVLFPQLFSMDCALEVLNAEMLDNLGKPG